MKPLLLYNGNFLPFSKEQKKIEGVLLNKGVIEKIFLKREKVSSNMKKIDLKGSYVIPGFTDSHTHLVSKGIQLQRIDLEKCHSLDECLEKLRHESSKDTELLFGVNWDESSWFKDEKAKLDRSLLDGISKTKPVIMRRVCGHYAVVNAKALQHIPKHWRIVDRRNGHLYEDAALNLNGVFKPTQDMLKKAIELATNRALSYGITSIHEISIASHLKVLQDMDQAGTLKLRIAIYLPLNFLDHLADSKIASGLGGDFLKFAGIKIFMDGSIGAKTAALSRSYKNTKAKGTLLFSAQQLAKIVRTAEVNGIQLMIHSIGDRATNEILKIMGKNIAPGNPLRHRLEHLEILDHRAIEKIAEMNLIASMQPNFVRRWQKPDGMYEQYLGRSYINMNPFKRMLDSGVRVIFGSDCMPLSPLYGLPGAIEHPNPDLRLDAMQAFKLYTKEPTYGTFDEDNKGTLEPGKFADLIVIDKNPSRAKNIDKMKVLMTIVAGRIIYQKPA